MAYSFDFSKIPVDNYREILRNQYLLPGRKILHNNIDASFSAICNAGIGNLCELKDALSTTKKMIEFSEKSKLSKDYLTILRREIGSLECKTVLIKDFPGIEAEMLDRVSNAGFISSKDYYEFYESVKDMKKIAQKLGISQELAEELYSLCNLVRINGVGAIAAKSFSEAGYKSISDIANTSAEEMLVKVSEVNNIKRYYKTKLGTKDMQFCIDFAKIIWTVENSGKINGGKTLIEI
ncbi:MAG: DUF4332 domain-containing protein [Clostridia bacterium]|nr:DUF4332 domain-containing protein [Clostridia bacterium]